MNIKRIAERELRQNIADREKCLQRLSELPEGTLRIEKRNGKAYYRMRAGGKDAYLRISDKDIVEMLKERKRLETVLKVVDGNIKALQALRDSYLPYSASQLEKLLPESYRRAPASSADAAGSCSSPEEWERGPYKRKAWSVNYKMPGHVTLKGDRVRSKSELIIANMLQTMKIPYHYEEEMVIGGITVAPDFHIYVRSESRFVILEHFGRMFDAGYQAEYGRKVGLYISNGYMPGRDLFMTYDDKDGNLDTQRIEELIELNFM